MEKSSGATYVDANQQDILFNYQSFEDNSNSRQRTRREVVLEDSDEFYGDRQKQMESESLQRMKRDQQKREINLPPGYSIYEIPKLPDKSPMPVFMHLNISKILDFDELNEVVVQLETRNNLSSILFELRLSNLTWNLK